jgi:hypothetical protein
VNSIIGLLLLAAVIASRGAQCGGAGFGRQAYEGAVYYDCAAGDYLLYDG